MGDIIVRFRTNTYGLSIDIEKALLHVGLAESDRDFTRLFWLCDPKDLKSEFEVFCFKTVLLGSTSSPFYYHLENYTSLVSKDMKDNIYVDNVISECDHESDTVHCYEEARSMMNAARFNLRSWTSNSPSLTTTTNIKGWHSRHQHCC